MNQKRLTFPFYSQVWNLEEWQKLGFIDKQEARYWQNSSCGILCLKMAIEGVLDTEIDPISNLIKKGLSLHGYSDEKGWSHAGLVKLAEQYGVTAISKGKLTTNAIINLLDDGAVLIISIKWAFIPVKTWMERLTFWKKKGGHLALIVGYEKYKGFYVNHTSTLENYNWENRLILFSEFKKGFTGRAIIIKGR